jgi:hypothetical protein
MALVPLLKEFIEQQRLWVQGQVDALTARQTSIWVHFAREFLAKLLRLDLGFLREKSYLAKSSGFSGLAGLFVEEPFTDCLFY